MNKEIQKLEEQILYHKSRYYQGNAEITDSEYDKLEDKLRKIDPKNKVLSLVGSAPTGANKVAHDQKMLSLNKVYELDELLNWIEDREVVSTYKIDGVSCSLIYKNGSLSIAKTRGDGNFGEDITIKANWIKDIRSSLGQNIEQCEVRGEIYCTEENFYTISKEMEKIGLEKPTSQRNIVAGLLGRKDHVELSRHLSFQAFELISDELKIKDEHNKFTLLKSFDFSIPDFQLHKNRKSIETTIDDARSFMTEGDYQIDGLVFTLNEIGLHDQLGATAHHPRYKMAFKYRGDSKVTTINDLEWGVSRNGILTPVAHVAPVELSGAEIRRVTLHNFGVVDQYNLKKGDEIEVVRSGEVIPKFLSVVKSTKGTFSYPKKCPSCEGPTRVESIRLHCDNKDCPVKVLENILHFIVKIGIDNLSTKRLEEMMRKGLVQEIADLYKITEEQLLTLDKTKEKLAQKIMAEIEKSRSVDLINFLSALGLSGGAYNKCEKVVHSGYNSLDKIKDLTLEQLVEIDGFAEKSASDFLQSLKEKMPIIEKLEKNGFSFKEIVIKENPIKGKKICITGALSEKRSVIEAKIRELGGVVSGSVGKSTDYLLTNESDSASSKFKKATDLGIEIISEKQFFEMV